MNVIITGGAGFIGANFVYYMLNKYENYKIICVDALTYAGNINFLNDAMTNPNFVFYKEDITNRNAIYKIFQDEKPDVVVNFAAESHVDRSINDPEIFLKTNIIGTSVLLDACCKYGVKRYHQISTDEVYGDLPLDRKDLMFKENSPLSTSSPYSASKASADLLVQSYHRTFNLPTTISRCTNNYGPYQFPEKLIPLTILNSLNGKPVTVYGKGLNVRDWIYVEDHCEAVDLIIHKGKNGEIYNIGANNEIKNIDLVKSVISLLDKEDTEIMYVADRKGHDLRYAIDSTKLKTELGWKPKTKFKDGLRSTIRWYLKNMSFWQ